MKNRCIDVPISWLELERYALGESQRPREIEAHLHTCSPCQKAMQSIQDDARTMPALILPGRESQRTSSSRWRFLLGRPSLALVPVLLLLLIVVFKGQKLAPEGSRSKGGELSFDLIRERDGSLLAPTHFRPQDRFKVQLSCGDAAQTVLLAIEQDGDFFYPLPVMSVQCGNQVVLPGAFSLDGGPARVCLVVRPEAAPPLGKIPDDAHCMHLLPNQSP